MRTIVISDIHGSFYTMKKLLDEINFNRIYKRKKVFNFYKKKLTNSKNKLK